MMRWVIVLVTLTAAAGCGGRRGGDGLGGLDRLQSPCVAGPLGLSRTAPDGSTCNNFSYSACGDAMASDCRNYCAFGLCQPAPCATYADCGWLGPTYDCEEYVVSGSNYGAWCDYSSCPRGTAGCPCLNGTCSGDGVVCNGSGFCEDTCPFGCRAGSVCCGGAFCSGECIGTPCCS